MLVFGVSLSLALGLQLEPEALAHVPETARILLSSGVLPAAVLAIVLNLVLPQETADEEAPTGPVLAGDGA
jgi:NCS2 family nucleobase:cation symporter-2